MDAFRVQAQMVNSHQALQCFVCIWRGHKPRRDCGQSREIKDAREIVSLWPPGLAAGVRPPGHGGGTPAAHPGWRPCSHQPGASLVIAGREPQDGTLRPEREPRDIPEGIDLPEGVLSETQQGQRD
jgi:hypothetical protein